ncbi:MAG: helix-turn-helix domain-containing protein [Gammaproteobacteria bacterium]
MDLLNLAGCPTPPRHEGPADTPHPSADHDRQAHRSRWRKSCRRRQSVDETAAPGYESKPETRTQSNRPDRFLPGFWSLLLSPRHIQRAAVILRPSTLLNFHRLLKQRKYRQLYSAHRKGKPGPKGSSFELIQAIIELKCLNPRFGCPRISQQINRAFGTDIDKDVVQRVLAIQYRPESGGSGPSWLTFLGHAKDG